jgi:hypothetical protein
VYGRGGEIGSLINMDFFKDWSVGRGNKNRIIPVVIDVMRFYFFPHGTQ